MGWSIGQSVGRSVGWSIGQSVSRSVGQVVGPLVSQSVGRVVGWSVSWLVSWLVGRSVSWSVSWLVHQLAGWLDGWMAGRLDGWTTGHKSLVRTNLNTNLTCTRGSCTPATNALVRSLFYTHFIRKFPCKRSCTLVLWLYTYKMTKCTVGFTFFPYIVGLVHKTPSYIECTRYSCNTSLIVQ
jgi:hypothetical protein